MKRKILALVLLCLVLLSACGNGGEATTTTTETTAESTTVTTTEATTESTTVTTTEATTATTLPKETDAEKSLESLRAEIKKEKAYIGVAYIGYYEGNYKNVISQLKKEGITEKYPFINEIDESDFYTLEGNEVYLVVPKKGVEILLFEHVFNSEGVGAPQRELNIYDDGTPFIIKGNISDIMPNYQIDARVNHKLQLEYNPCLSLENGKLLKQKGIYDFSPYELLPFFE